MLSGMVLNEGQLQGVARGVKMGGPGKILRCYWGGTLLGKTKQNKIALQCLNNITIDALFCFFFKNLFSKSVPQYKVTCNTSFTQV